MCHSKWKVEVGTRKFSGPDKVSFENPFADITPKFKRLEIPEVRGDWWLYPVLLKIVLGILYCAIKWTIAKTFIFCKV